MVNRHLVDMEEAEPSLIDDPIQEDRTAVSDLEDWDDDKDEK